MIICEGGGANLCCDTTIIIIVIIITFIIISQATILSLCAEADSRVKEVWTEMKSISLVLFQYFRNRTFFHHSYPLSYSHDNGDSIITPIMIGGWLNQSAMVLDDWLGPPKVLKWCHSLSFSLAITFCLFSKSKCQAHGHFLTAKDLNPFYSKFLSCVLFSTWISQGPACRNPRCGEPDLCHDDDDDLGDDHRHLIDDLDDNQQDDDDDLDDDQHDVDDDLGWRSTSCWWCS